MKGFSVKTYLVHVTAWMIFITYELAAVYFFSGIHSGIATTLIYYVLYILLFYGHALLVLPLTEGRKGALWMRMAFLALELTVCIAIKYLLDRKLGYSPLMTRRYFFLGCWRSTGIAMELVITGLYG